MRTGNRDILVDSMIHSVVDGIMHGVLDDLTWCSLAAKMALPPEQQWLIAEAVRKSALPACVLQHRARRSCWRRPRVVHGRPACQRASRGPSASVHELTGVRLNGGERRVVRLLRYAPRPVVIGSSHMARLLNS